MEVFGILCGMLFWGPVILAWCLYLKKGKPPKAIRLIGNAFFVAFLLLILGSCGKMELEDTLSSAAEEGNTVTAERLVSMGVNINCEDENWHYTPLMWAARNGHTETVIALLRHHPDLKHQGSGDTALGVAIEHNHPDIVHVLEAAGPSY